ncbi:hypothetical protein AB0A77_00140 [Streptomyces varsoviensis]|uniref:hypothetical protein n=1 Tax=Streptomyces varsoviensis TaxID=67373 RepID=UPI0033C71A5B
MARIRRCTTAGAKDRAEKIAETGRGKQATENRPQKIGSTEKGSGEKIAAGRSLILVFDHISLPGLSVMSLASRQMRVKARGGWGVVEKTGAIASVLGHC